MSKVNKLLTSPKLFFADMVAKRLNNKDKDVVAQPTIVSIPKPKPKPKPVPVNTKAVQSLELSLSNLNMFLPCVILHTGEKDNALAHISIWYPYFKQAGVYFIIVTRFLKAYEELLKAYPDANLVFAKDKQDVDRLFSALPKIKACFYPSNTGNNAHLLYHTKLKHVFIGHGDSDKSSSAHKYFRVYDENWVAGQAHIDRFDNEGLVLNGLTHVQVGRPSLSLVLEDSQNTWSNRFNGQVNALYLPTWEGILLEQNYSSLHIAQLNVEAMQSPAITSLSVKLHPLTGNRQKELAGLETELKGNGLKTHVISRSETLDSYIQKCNLFICDISAVVSECLAANAPIFLYVPKDKQIKIAGSNIPYEDYCYTYSDPEELSKKIDDVIGGNDYLAPNRIKAAEYIIGVEKTLEKEFIRRLKVLGGLS